MGLDPMILVFWMLNFKPTFSLSSFTLITLTYLINFSAEVHHVKFQTEWITNWNQDCLERYQQLQICRWYHFNGRKWRGTKELLDEVKEMNEKAGLERNIQKMKIMASGSITLWQIDGENVETVSDFIFLVSKINVGGDCSHKIKRCLLFERIAMRNLDSILKSRDITLLTKVRIIKAMVFPVVMYGCESWTIKKA